MQETIRGVSDEIAVAFERWAIEQSAAGVRLMALEALPGAGKSRMQKALPAGFHAIDLDRFLPTPPSLVTPWLKQVEDGGAIDAIRTTLSSCDCLVVAGAESWWAVSKVADLIGADAVRRIYLMRMSSRGGVIGWSDGEKLLKGIVTRSPNIQSVYQYHKETMPWVFADLIIERIDAARGGVSAPIRP